MIRSLRHKGLERFFVKGSKSGVEAAHSQRLRLILGRLHTATSPQDMELPGLYLHQLKGKYRGRWSVRVTGNWGLTFKFKGPDAVEGDYEDYH